MDNSTRLKLFRLVTRLGTRDTAALRRGRPVVAAQVAAGGDAQLDTGASARIAVLR